MQLRRTLHGATGRKSVVGGKLAAIHPAGRFVTSGPGTHEAVGLPDLRLLHRFSALFRPGIFHQEQT